MKKKKRSIYKNRSYILFSLPAILVYLVFFIYPILISFLYSVTDWNGISDTYNIVGLKNYTRIFEERRVTIGIVNTLTYTIATVILQNIVALTLAVILTAKLKIIKTMRVFFFWPVLISTTVVAYIWTYLYRYLDGPINMMFRSLGLDFLAQDWLGDPKIALYSIVVTSVWQLSGYFMVIYITGIENIPSSLYEAAYIDGASTFQRLFKITIPMLAPSFTICITLSTIWGLKVFDAVYIMTGGGPGYATETLTTIIYQKAFQERNVGLSCAISVVLFICMALISVTQNHFLKKKEVNL